MRHCLYIVDGERQGTRITRRFRHSEIQGKGMRVVIALTQQLGGTITYHSGVSGTEFILSIPIAVRAGSSSSEPDVT